MKNIPIFSEFKGCTSQIGPHTLDCLDSLWSSVGCVFEGRNHPRKLSPLRRRIYNNAHPMLVLFIGFKLSTLFSKIEKLH